MRSTPNYENIKQIISELMACNEAVNIKLAECFKEPSHSEYDNKANQFTNEALVANIKKSSLSPFLNDEIDSKIPKELFLLLYVHDILKSQIGEHKTFRSVIEIIASSALYNNINILDSDLHFYALGYYLIAANVEWDGFTSDFDGKDWTEIHSFQQLLPLGKLTVDGLCNWIKKVVKEQERDGALVTIGESIYTFVILLEDVTMIEQNIKRFVTEKYVSSFFAAILMGLKYKQQKPYTFYYSLLKNEINSSTGYDILFAIGRISTENEKDRNEYFSILSANYTQGMVDLKGYLGLCANFNFYNDVVFSSISSALSEAVKTDAAFILIHYLDNAPDDIDIRWLTSTSLALFIADAPQTTVALDSLLTKISESNIDLAFTILEKRLHSHLGNNMLENAIVNIAHVHQHLFQEKFIEWLNSDNTRLHIALGKLTAIHSLGRGLFYIPKDIYDNLNFSEKIFIAYKSIGYIHSMERLQELFISLIKSVNIGPDIFGEQISYSLNEYLIYNYRGTLELVKNEIKRGDLSNFAEKIFKSTLDTYEVYFDKLKSVSAKKELSVPLNMLQLKGFYQRKQFEATRKNTRTTFLQDMFGQVLLNSNKWALRRPDELKHVVQELGEVSVSMEFPSGEILDPFHQEFIRRRCQKIKKNEINID